MVDNTSESGSHISGTTSNKSTISPQMFIDSHKGNIKERYHFNKKLANGGFGVVYLAEHRQTKELYAVKAIQKRKVKDYATFVNEINILKVLVSVPLRNNFLGPPEYHQALRNLGME
jgi:serine/threonine protein kinase